MKRLIVLSLITAGIVLMAGISTPTQAQSPANDLKPTFLSPTPGLYVNGWPLFTVSYPKEWVEGPAIAGFALSVGVPRPDLPPDIYLPGLSIVVVPSSLPLEDWAKQFMPVVIEGCAGRDVKVLSDKPSQLKDGTPAREIEWEGAFENGPKDSAFALITKKDVTWVAIILDADRGKLGRT